MPRGARSFSASGSAPTARTPPPPDRSPHRRRTYRLASSHTSLSRGTVELSLLRSSSLLFTSKGKLEHAATKSCHAARRNHRYHSPRHPDGQPRLPARRSGPSPPPVSGTPLADLRARL